MTANLIKRSTLQWSFPLVNFRERGGSIKVTADYERLNATSIGDKYPPPRVVDSIDSSRPDKIYSAYDLMSAYH